MKTTFYAVIEIAKIKQDQKFTFSAKKLELYEAPNSSSSRLKVSYSHPCFFRQKLRRQSGVFPFVWDVPAVHTKR